MGLGERIRKCAELAGSGDKLAQKTAIPRRTLETYLSGDAEPKAERLSRICAAVGVDANWLINGTPPMFREADQPEFFMVPRYGIEPTSPLPQEVARVSLSLSWLVSNGMVPHDLAFIDMPDDSMSPTINERGIVVVHTASQLPKTDGMYAFQRDGELVVKRLQLTLGGGCLIRSDNTLYREIAVSEAEMKSLTVAGKVVWAGGRL